jgi:Asp-tRNA(Asn)/Glu-tRNA(Gln) amidotransferase A subunit family amidase
MFSSLNPGDRKRLFNKCAHLRVVSNSFVNALACHLRKKTDRPITVRVVRQAARIAGIELSRHQMRALIESLNVQRSGYHAIRQIGLRNETPPAFIFNPVLGDASRISTETNPLRFGADFGGPPTKANIQLADDLESLAFASISDLGQLLRQRKVSSRDLTEMYLRRLKRYDSVLHFVIHLTEERARVQAEEADAEISRGRYRGPLHGIPWGAKDLLAVKGYPTTWGAGGLEQQFFDEDATVVQRLDEAGAVLIAKLSLGTLGGDDKWFGRQTRNPWNPKRGSGGSSAGSASATAAGCVGFAIGSETLGSISLPSAECGVTGYRPTFGFVPRTGAMALAWTMDKLGPIARTAEDCALVMQAIYGPDGKDHSVRAASFKWDSDFDWKKLRVGYFQRAFDIAFYRSEEKIPNNHTSLRQRQYVLREEELSRVEYDLRYAREALERLSSMGIEPQPVELPSMPLRAIVSLLGVEGAAAFDELAVSGPDRQLTAHEKGIWSTRFRARRLFPAVEYIQANRVRTLLMQQMAEIFENIDIIVSPTFHQRIALAQSMITNLTGHPAVILPNGFRGADAPASFGGVATPVGLTFVGNLYQDAVLLAFAKAYQAQTTFHQIHPSDARLHEFLIKKSQPIQIMKKGPDPRSSNGLMSEVTKLRRRLGF